MSLPRQNSLAGWGGWREAAAPLEEEGKTYFKRYLYRNYRGFASFAHYCRRRITVAGWMVLGGTMVAAVLGADTNASQSYQTFSLLGCLALVAGLCLPLGRPK